MKNTRSASASIPASRRRLWAAGRRVMDPEGAQPATARLPSPRLREARRRVRRFLPSCSPPRHHPDTPSLPCPSPPWGRGWTAAGAFIRRGGPGEGVPAGLLAASPTSICGMLTRNGLEEPTLLWR